MRSKARIANHPIHPMLILIPAGAFVITLVCDLLYLLTEDSRWWDATAPIIVVGVVGGILAAVPGVIDFVTIVPHHKVRRIASVHMVLNLFAVGFFAINGWIRWNASTPPTGVSAGLVLTLLGILLLAVSGWLGGTLVFEHRVGVVEPGEMPPARAPER